MYQPKTLHFGFRDLILYLTDAAYRVDILCYEATFKIIHLDNIQHWSHDIRYSGTQILRYLI